MKLDTQGVAISILLKNGDPNGIKKISMVHSSMDAYVIPRNMLETAIRENNLGNVAIYFLFGFQNDDEDSLKPKVYIGQTDASGRRIKEQRAKKDFWDTAVVFTSHGNRFNLTHADFLEAYCYIIMKEIDRYNVVNESCPSLIDVTDEDRANITHFYKFVKQILSTLGFPVLEEAESINNEIWTCKGTSSKKGKDVIAEGTFVTNGFRVFAGSQAVLDENVSQSQKYILDARKHLINDVLIPDRNCYIFAKDYIFINHTTAARIILGYSCVGDEKWKNTDGKSIKDINLEELED